MIKREKVKRADTNAEKTKKVIKEKIDKLVDSRMSTISFHCEGGCDEFNCGSEVASVECPPCVEE